MGMIQILRYIIIPKCMTKPIINSEKVKAILKKLRKVRSLLYVLIRKLIFWRKSKSLRD